MLPALYDWARESAIWEVLDWAIVGLCGTAILNQFLKPENRVTITKFRDWIKSFIRRPLPPRLIVLLVVCFLAELVKGLIMKHLSSP